MSAVVLLEWKFSPPDYFEEVIEISRNDYMMTIADGQVHAKIDSATYEADPEMQRRLHDALTSRFLGVQLLTHRAFELSHSTMTRVPPDGHRVIYPALEPLRKVGSIALDIRVTNKDGNVTTDSKRECIERKNSLAELVAAHRGTNSLLDSLLQSYNTAVSDPNDEFVHLYEIRDALQRNFGCRNAALTALGIVDSQWNRLGKLCNDEPLRQGRHRGKTGEALRDANEAELVEARDIARTMIEAYLQYIDGSATP